MDVLLVCNLSLCNLLKTAKLSLNFRRGDFVDSATPFQQYEARQQGMIIRILSSNNYTSVLQ